MKLIAPGIQQWSFFSEEKQLDFNGLLLTVNDHCVLVDPPPMEAADRAAILKGQAVDYILLTNRDHVRDAEACRRDFQAKVFAPVADAPLMGIPIDKTYQDGELLPGGLWVIHLQDMKSPGESALFLDRGKGYLILGDSLIGKPAGRLSLLPAEKFADVAKARESLRRLLKYNFETVLVGDGVSVLTGGKEAVRLAIEA
jgi:glyoxylase-like metal-dependent hydrolase (beta-lactamase superfamily II)